MNAQPFLVPDSFTDAAGSTRVVNPVTVTAALRAIGAPSRALPLILEPGQGHPDLADGLWTLDGEEISCQDGRAPDAGYYRSPGGRLVIVAPARLPQPDRGWGWSVQLYAARSATSWGIGDFTDLATIATSAAAGGAGCVLISPVHAAAPVSCQQASPYSPTSRRWLQLLHVDVTTAPGAHLVDLTDLATAGRAMNATRLIDRDAVWSLKREGLERIWSAVEGDLPADYHAWAARQGQALTRFATWCALAEEHDTADWRTWPAVHRTWVGMAAWSAGHPHEIGFFAWAQWVAHTQFASACRAGATVVADVAVGFDRGSFDGWDLRDVAVDGFEVGCPPDNHNLEGQRWGLPPLSPAALVDTDFAPFVGMVAATLEHAGALRIDHVMQLWRLFWVPTGGSAADGVYVHYPVGALLAILRVEADRAGAWVVGEDMGTVADGVREQMAACGMLGFRSALRMPPERFPELVMGCSSTHDQATVVGTLTGCDTADLARIGKPADFAALDRVRRDLAACAGVDLGAVIGAEQREAAVLAQYARVGRSAARVVLASLDDAAGLRERPNMPGTVTTYPNWCLGLPRPVEDVLSSPLARQVAATLSERCAGGR